MKILKLTWTEN